MIEYAENPDKTTDPRYLDDDLSNVLKYAEKYVIELGNEQAGKDARDHEDDKPAQFIFHKRQHQRKRYRYAIKEM